MITEPNNHYLFRQIQIHEVSILRKLLCLFGEVFEDRETYQDNQPEDDYLHTLLKSESFIAIVAISKREVIGGLTAYVLNKFEQNRREIYIYDLAVKKTYRRQKIATQLIFHLRQIAKQMQAYVIFVQADQGDTPAIKLYESLGNREDIHHFDINVDI